MSFLQSSVYCWAIKLRINLPYCNSDYICPIRKLFANISIVVLLNVLIKPAWVVAENMVQNEVGHAAFGIYAAFLSFGFLFIMFSDLGINQYLIKRMSSEPELVHTFFPNLFTLKIILTALYPLMMVGAGWLMITSGRFSGASEQGVYYLFLLSLVHGGHQLLQFFRANFQARQLFKLDGVASVFDKAVLLVAIAILLLTSIDIERYILTRVVVSWLSVIVFYMAILRIYGWIKPTFDLDFVKKTLKASWPFALITILYSVNDKVDQVMLLELAGNHETGLYAAAYRWLDVFGMYLWTVLAIFYARSAFHNGNIPELNKLLKFGQVVTAIPLIFVSVWVFFYGEKLLWIYDNSTSDEIAIMAQCLSVLFITLFVNGFLMQYSNMLTAIGYERYVNRMIIIGIVINVVLNFIFIPQYGAIAAAWSTTASLSLLGFSYLWHMHQKLPLKIPYGTILKLLVASVGLGGAFFFLRMLPIPWYGVSGMAGVVYLGLIFGLKLVPFGELKGFINKKDQA